MDDLSSRSDREKLLEALGQCLERLPESAPAAARLVQQIMPQLEKDSYSQQMGRVMLVYLQGMLPNCQAELGQWLAEIRHPERRRHALPGAPPPPTG